MARRYLEATARHQTIRAAEVKDERILAKASAKELEKALVGKQFHSVLRHGKRLFVNYHALKDVACDYVKSRVASGGLTKPP
jgi:formamidopyrimidine-DNA glycosylase